MSFDDRVFAIVLQASRPAAEHDIKASLPGTRGTIYIIDRRNTLYVSHLFLNCIKIFFTEENLFLLILLHIRINCDLSASHIV